MFLNVISGNLGYYWLKIMESDLLTCYFVYLYFLFINSALLFASTLE